MSTASTPIGQCVPLAIQILRCCPDMPESIEYHLPAGDRLFVGVILIGGLVVALLGAAGATGFSLFGMSAEGAAGRVMSAAAAVAIGSLAIPMVGRFALRRPAVTLSDEGLTTEFGYRVRRVRWSDIESVGSLVVPSSGFDGRARYFVVTSRDGSSTRVPSALDGVEADALRAEVQRRAALAQS